MLAATRRYRANTVRYDDEILRALPGLTVHDLMLLPIDRAQEFFDTSASARAARRGDRSAAHRNPRAASPILTQVGLGYLTLDRQSRTLSGGEVQRINLTTALGTSLVNTLFVLDEPSIGLHPRDMGRVIGVMQRLRDAGNSLVVVEHDPQIMLAADRILDIGPGPGERGGEIVFFDTPERLKQHAHADRRISGGPQARRQRHRADAACCATAPRSKCSAPPSTISRTSTSRFRSTGWSASPACRARANRRWCRTCSMRRCCKHKGKPTETPGAHRAIHGHELIDDVVMVDQSPIGRTTRSNPASYVGAFDAIRKLFAQAPLAKERGYTRGTFSFNSGNGRCPTCGGNGFEHVEMQFLSDVYLRCPDCDGKRFRAEVLEVTIDGKSIADVLEMTVAEALDVLCRAPGRADRVEAARRRRPRLPAPRPAGADAVRRRSAAPEARRPPRRARSARARKPTRSDAAVTLFLFDEPTTGLHFDDVAKLLRAFRQLIAAGHSLVVIEHNLDVIAPATGSSTSAPKAAKPAARSFAPARRRMCGSMRRRTPGRRCGNTKLRLPSMSHASYTGKSDAIAVRTQPLDYHRAVDGRR